MFGNLNSKFTIKLCWEVLATIKRAVSHFLLCCIFGPFGKLTQQLFVPLSVLCICENRNVKSFQTFVRI